MAPPLEVFAKSYASMPDEDLQRLALDIKSLTPEARTALRLDMERRELPTEAFDWTAQPELLKEESSGAFRLFLRNFGIFFVCDVLYIVVIGGILSNLHSIDAEKIGGAMTKAFLNISLLAAIITSKFLVPKKLKTVWIVGAFAPPFAFMLFLLFK